MKKIYRSDLGSLVFVGFGVLLFLALTLFVFFTFGGAPLKVKACGILLTLFSSVFLYSLVKYELIITDDSISSTIFILSFLNKYQTMKFEEVEKVYNAIGPFSDMQMIIFKSRDKTKKPMSIMVGFGLPWQALLDVLQHLPKNTEINFEPFLWKRIKRYSKPGGFERVKRLSVITTAILVFITAGAILYTLWKVFSNR